MLTLQKNDAVTYTVQQLWEILAPGGALSAWRIEPSRSSLPPGMTATSAELSGAPTTIGSYTVVMSRDAGLGEYVYSTIPIAVKGAPPVPADPMVASMLQFLGMPGDTELAELAKLHVPILTSFVKAYTRGRGFDEFGNPSNDVESVILTAGARLVVNPEQAVRVQIGDYSETPAVFSGFTLAELAVLNRYRRRSA